MDNLEFLVDVVPKTVPFKEVKEKKAPTNAGINGEGSMETGQTTLDAPLLNGTNGTGSHVAGAELLNGEEKEADEDVGDPNAQLEMEIRGANANRMSIGSEGVANGKDEDVEMN